MVRIGFDIGGTRIKAGIVGNDGAVLEKRSIPFRKGRPIQEITQEMRALAFEMLENIGMAGKEAAFIGVAVPGRLDRTGDVVLDAYNLGFHQVPLKAEMEICFAGIPVRLVNDANAAALAELHLGALRGCTTGVLLTLGTGVGGGLILDGKMFNGGMAHGVELGHMTLMEEGDLCTCGNRGCLETVCAATWLEKQGQGTAETVIDRAKKGDPVCREIFDRYVSHLASAIISLAALLDPEIFALGGGVSLAGDFLFEPLRQEVERRSFFKHAYRIVPTALGNDAGFMGAAMLSNHF